MISNGKEGTLMVSIPIKRKKDMIYEIKILACSLNTERNRKEETITMTAFP